MIIVFAIYSILYGISYFAIFVLFTAFFDKVRMAQFAAAIRTIPITILFLAITFVLVYLIPDQWWGNRVQHVMGGGITASFMCRRIIRDAELKLNRFRILIFCSLTVTALGVANELAESVLQASTGIILSPTTVDTWLDLWSNTIGIIIASFLFL
ncbi:MAG: hypothetical protein JO001_27840 [Alphaproteobacteria bacterium]|nr:hypothetical protein [Alphaproteobacteria bacterium]